MTKKNVVFEKVLIFIGLAIILFINNGKLSLWDQDEAAYAGFAKRMIETHNYVVPDFTWSFPHRKPPMHFWLISLSYEIFGVNEFAVRFFVALSLLGVYLMIYFFGKRFIGERQAFFSAIILGTSFFAPLLGKIAVTDGLLLFFHTLAGFSLLYILEEKRWIYVFWFYFAVAGGLLVKGPPILIFVGIFVVILFVLHPKRKNLLILHPWFFGWFALLPLLWWGYKAWQQDPEFIRWLIDWYIVRRTKGAVFGQTGPVGYYLISITIFFASYFVFFPSALKNSFEALWQREKNNWFIIGAWIIAGWLIYEFIKSKLPAYVIAAYPGIAMALGYQIFYSIKKNTDFTLMRISAIFQLIIVLSFVFGIVFLSKSFFQEKEDYIQTIFIVLTYLVLMILGLIQIWKGKIIKGAKILILGSGIFLFLSLSFVLPKLDHLRNAPRRVALYIKDYVSNPSQIIVGNKFADPPSLPFYLETYIPNSELIYTQNIKVIDSLFINSENCVLILDEKQLTYLLEKNPEIKYNLIFSHATDRKGNLEYYIVIKQKNNVLSY